MISSGSTPDPAIRNAAGLKSSGVLFKMVRPRYNGGMNTTEAFEDAINQIDGMIDRLKADAKEFPLFSRGIDLEIASLRKLMGRRQRELAFALMHDMIDDLFNEQDPDDAYSRVSSLSRQQTLEILAEASMLGCTIPFRDACPDSEDGIRIEWLHPNGSRVTLAVPVLREPYVYHDDGKVYGSEKATGKSLAKWLQDLFITKQLQAAGTR